MLTTGQNLGQLDNADYGEGCYFELLRFFRALDTLVQPHVLSATTTAPPATPAEGDAYVVPTGATGDWASNVGDIARWTARSAAGDPVGTPLWEFITPKRNWSLGVDDTDHLIKFNGTAWVTFVPANLVATLADFEARLAALETP